MPESSGASRKWEEYQVVLIDGQATLAANDRELKAAMEAMEDEVILVKERQVQLLARVENHARRIRDMNERRFPKLDTDLALMKKEAQWRGALIGSLPGIVAVILVILQWLGPHGRVPVSLRGVAPSAAAATLRPKP